MEPNKVKFMDGPDTYFANVGRHSDKEPRLMRAKTFPHLVFTDPPASPDREEEQNPRQERAASNPPGEASKATPDSTTASQEPPSLEMPEAPSVPLEPRVVVVPYPGAPIPEKEDSDCEITEDPARVQFKPKKGWTKRRMEQTKKTLVLCLPRCDAFPVKREEAGAAQREDPPAPEVEGEYPGVCEADEPPSVTQEDSGSGSMDEQE